jgi:hypothetical protein
VLRCSDGGRLIDHLVVEWVIRGHNLHFTPACGEPVATPFNVDTRDAVPPWLGVKVVLCPPEGGQGATDIDQHAITVEHTIYRVR